MSVFQGFKDFIARGNVIDLAVAVVIGAAFTTVVTALVDQLFNPLIGAVFNADSLANAFLIEIPTTSGGAATLGLGAILAAIINFLIVAAVVYFVFVLPINKLNERHAQGQESESEVTELDLLTEIRDLLNERHK
nr:MULTISPECIES: large conductance mechanosensitive channel protein MscL [unclassified Leucobacter]